MRVTTILNGKKVNEDSPEWIAFCKKTEGRFAEMCEARQAPGAHTDREFMRNVGVDQCRDNDLDPETFELYKKKAAAAGVNVAGKKYYGSLASHCGDKEAWCSDMHDVKKLAEKRGQYLRREDGVLVKSPVAVEPVDDGPYRVDDDVVDEFVGMEIQKNPDAAHENQTDLRERIRDEITPEE